VEAAVVVWRRLSERTGKRKPSVQHESIPPFLLGEIIGWLQRQFEMGPYGSGMMRGDVVRRIARMNEIATHPFDDDSSAFQRIMDACSKDADVCLDVIDNLLYLEGESSFPIATKTLSEILQEGRAGWDIAPDRRSLVRRTDPTGVEQFALASSPPEIASEKLASAWHYAYGRYPDPSHAWSDAIKACEAILIPLVCPKKAKANLGSVAGDLKAAPYAWKLVLDGTNGIGGVLTLEAMLRLLWPEPGRHPDGTHGPGPTIEQAQAAVQIAVTIVQLTRSRALVKK
jgi:hypothetical protein